MESGECREEREEKVDQKINTTVGIRSDQLPYHIYVARAAALNAKLRILGAI